MEYIKGVDISTLREVEACGGHFSGPDGEDGDFCEILSDFGINYVRIRLWNDPYSEDGKPYGAGTCDLINLVELALRVKAAGMKILLDFHYSDFWADPGKQNKPKAWRGFGMDKLPGAVYDYTRMVMETIYINGVWPDMVQVGNELTAGLCWPEGRIPEYKNVEILVSSGIRAIKELTAELNAKTGEALISLPEGGYLSPEAEDLPHCYGVSCPTLMIHLDNGGNKELYRSWFDNYFANGGEDFDVIGMSYYPFWHGTLNDLRENMLLVHERFNKPLIIAEVSMGFTTEDYGDYEQLAPEDRQGMATRPELCAKVPYPMSVRGQFDFMADFLKTLEQVPNGEGLGFFWWEAGWIPVPGSGWATPEALAYTGEKGPGGNEWANQALFDFDGEPLPTLELIRRYER